jgi:hypothetical protein
MYFVIGIRFVMIVRRIFRFVGEFMFGAERALVSRATAINHFLVTFIQNSIFEG